MTTRRFAFLVDTLGFEPVEDETAPTNDGQPKCWVMVGPTGAQLALAASVPPRSSPSSSAATGVVARVSRRDHYGQLLAAPTHGGTAP